MPSRSMLAKIHIAKKQLCLDEDEYRFIMSKHCNGKTSAKDLTDKEASALMIRFQQAGFKIGKPRLVKNGHCATKKVNDNYRKIKPGPSAKQQRYILAMWNALGYDVKKLDARCKQQFGVDRIEWVTDHHQLHVLITDLKARCEAAGIDHDPRG